MKFKNGDMVLYVNPFIFTIEVVTLEHQIQDETGLYWIDSFGAYLNECDCHKTLDDAREDALNKLHRFYVQKEHEIKFQQPLYSEGE